MGLMLLARGLQRRLDAAWVLTLGLIGFGAVASLLKGLDYEEALILTLIGLALLPGRRLFFRKASLFSESLTPGWFVAITIVIGASIWLGLFAFRHVDYAHDLWWHFSFKGQAPRFMRATVGAMALALMFGLSRLLRVSLEAPQHGDWDPLMDTIGSGEDIEEDRDRKRPDGNAAQKAR